MLVRWLTHNAQRAPAGKRERLAAGASKLLHHNGVAATSLAEIAQAADVPLGNVYHYFKSKDELIRAVVAEHIEEVDTMADPHARARVAAGFGRWSTAIRDGLRHCTPPGISRRISTPTTSSRWPSTGRPGRRRGRRTGRARRRIRRWRWSRRPVRCCQRHTDR